MDQLNFSICPRCDDRSLETLESYSHCVNCSYSPSADDVRAAFPRLLNTVMKPRRIGWDLPMIEINMSVA